MQPNDLVVTAGGLVYITETGKKQVTLINPKTKAVTAKTVTKKVATKAK